MQINIEEYEFYVRPGTTDMRKRATSLSRIVQDQMKIMPFSKAVFLFCGKDRRKNHKLWLIVSVRVS